MKVGIIGAGQLGQMLGRAGQALGFEFVFLDPAENPPARDAGSVLALPFDSEEGLAKLADCDVVSYEFENVPHAALVRLASRVPVFPPVAALRHAQDRLREKELFEDLAIPVPEWRAVSSRSDLAEAMRSIGLPLLLKTRRLGYDGKGQFKIRSEEDADRAWADASGKELIAEQWIRFDREVSVIGARSVDGDIAIYPMTENYHQDGILRYSKAPAEGAAVAEVAAAHLSRLLLRLDYVGVLALELFVVDGRVLANEYAPRVHNSGHWTIEGAKTSQFENHLRAIAGLPLGDTSNSGHAAMVNLIGSLPDLSSIADGSGVYLHEYGKEARPGRKLGHVTIIRSDAPTRNEMLDKTLKLLGK